MFFYKVLLAILFYTNIFAINASREELDLKLRTMCAPGGAMASFAFKNKCEIQLYSGFLPPEVTAALLKAFDHGGHMEGFFEWDKVYIFKKAPREADTALSLLSMFDRDGCMHTARKSLKIHLLNYFKGVNKDDAHKFLNLLRFAIKNSASQDDIRECCFSMRLAEFTPGELTLRENRIGMFYSEWNAWKDFCRSNPDSPIAPLLSINNYLGFFCAAMYEKLQDFTDKRKRLSFLNCPMTPLSVIVATYQYAFEKKGDSQVLK
jgi:hypothetical protein